jgi:succinyl-diaminopimelate desuccinylase
VCHPNIGQKGLVRLELRFSGSPGHGSLYPTIGRSAIAEALAFIDYLSALHREEFTSGKEMDEILARSSRVLAEEFGLPQASEVLKSIMFNPGVIAGGEKSNIVAQVCDLDLEMRIPWGCNIDRLLQDIQRHAPHGMILSRIAHEPSLTDPDCRIVAVTCDAVGRIYGRSASPIVQWAASDARHLRSAGFRVIEYGPGELRTLHAIDEHVTIQSLEKAAEVYGEIMRTYAMPDSG